MSGSTFPFRPSSTGLHAGSGSPAGVGTCGVPSPAQSKRTRHRSRVGGSAQDGQGEEHEHTDDHPAGHQDPRGHIINDAGAGRGHDATCSRGRRRPDENSGPGSARSASRRSNRDRTHRRARGRSHRTNPVGASRHPGQAGTRTCGWPLPRTHRCLTRGGGEYTRPARAYLPESVPHGADTGPRRRDLGARLQFLNDHDNSLLDRLYDTHSHTRFLASNSPFELEH